MEPYDALNDPDPYFASRDAFECPVSTPADASAASLAHDGLELLLKRQGHELLRRC